MTNTRMGVNAYPSPYEGKWVPWWPSIIQPGGNGPSGYTTTGTAYTIVDGVFYGRLYVRVPSTSDFGNISAHWELTPLPYTPIKTTSNDTSLIGWGYILRDTTISTSYECTRLTLGTFVNYPDSGIIWPIYPGYNPAYMDNPPDADLAFESWENGSAAKVDPIKSAMQSISTDFGRESAASLQMHAYMRFIIAD